MTFAQFKAGFLAMFTVGSMLGNATCHNQSAAGGGGEAAKDPAPAAEVTLPGVDTSALTTREKSEWSTYVNEFLSPCSDVPVSVAQCVKEKRNCPKCVPAAKFLVKGVRDGQTRDQVEKAYKNRFDASKIKNIVLDGSPTRGADSAPITIVEFADFECPHCAMKAPELDKFAEENKEKVRFVFKFLPLQGHPHGEIAARAAFAAFQQGKFWEMNKKLFANREHLEQSDLDSYAKELGLDMAKFKADSTSQACTDRLATDKKLADQLEVKGTPAIFINGREHDGRTDMKDWVNVEMAMMGTPAASGTPSAAVPVTSGSAKGPSDAGARK
jgi:protein-disulfide isomerase